MNEPDARFCGGCGTALALGNKVSNESRGADAALNVQEPADRRPVSVMFVDLSGYTALSAAADPEDTRRLLGQFFDLVDSIVISFGGTIDKHIGDSVMALFGAPTSHGNDPERAVRTALEIHSAMPKLTDPTGRSLTVHIGIALGEVVASRLGSVEHASYTVTGDAANLAARLMDRAAPGETLVSEGLRDVTDAVASFELIGAEKLKGLVQPIQIYRLMGLRSDPAIEQPMIGREGELAQLLAILDTCKNSRRGGAISIRGDPGIGKSRLLRELDKEARARGFQCIAGRVLDFGGRTGEDALAAITAKLVGSSVELPIELKSQSIQLLVDKGCVEDADRPFLHDLLGIAQPEENQTIYAAMSVEARRRGMNSVLAKLLRSACETKPCLVLIEDVHWANEATLSLLARLASDAGACAATIVMTTRIDGDPFDAAWRAESGGLSASIELRPLRPEDSIGLVAGIASNIDAFAHQCIERAEGNPLFLEQLIRSRLSDTAGKLPHSLQGVILARLDSLTEVDRLAMQAASILGQRFALDDLRFLSGLVTFDCRPMVHRKFLRSDGDGYSFAHALIRDGIYASLTRERRRELHLKAAGYFQDRDIALWAEHLDRAEDPAAALAYLAAAEAAAHAYRFDRANEFAARGLELAMHSAERVKLGLVVGRLRLDSGIPKSAREAFEIAAGAAQQESDRCRAFVGLAAVDRMLADLDSALENLAAAETIAETLAEPALLAEIHYMRGNIHFALGQGDACLQEHQLALEAANQSDMPEWKARVSSGLGDAAYLQGKVATARRHFARCVELAERHDLLRVIAANRCMIADCMAFYLEFDEALAEIAAGRTMAISIGDRFCEMFSLQSESFLLLYAGRLAEAESPTEAALELAIKLGTRRYEAFLLAVLAQLRLSQGHAGEALTMLNSAMSLAEMTGIGFCGPLICGALATLHGPGEQGRSWINRGEELLQRGGLVHNHVYFRSTAIEWAINACDWKMTDRIARELSEYSTNEPMPFVDFVVRRARAFATLDQDPDDLQAIESVRQLTEIARTVDFRVTWPRAFSGPH